MPVRILFCRSYVDRQIAHTTHVVHLRLSSTCKYFISGGDVALTQPFAFLYYCC